MLSASLQSTWDTQRARQKQPKYGAPMYHQNASADEQQQRGAKSLFGAQQHGHGGNNRQSQDFNTTQYSELPNLRNPPQVCMRI